MVLLRLIEVTEECVEHLTGSADFHLFVPIALNCTFTDGAINEPTEPSRLELPGWTLFLSLWRAFFNNPARLQVFLFLPKPRD